MIDDYWLIICESFVGLLKNLNIKKGIEKKEEKYQWQMEDINGQ